MPTHGTSGSRINVGEPTPRQPSVTCEAHVGHPGCAVTPDRPEQPKWKRLESGTTLVSQRLKKRTYDASRRFGVGLTLSSTSRIRKKSSSSSRQPDQRRCQGFDRSVTAISVACRYLNGRSDRPAMLARGARSAIAPIPAAGAGTVFDVRSFGTAGDGKTIDSPAINRAIEAAGAKGGTVYVPAGTYACFTSPEERRDTLRRPGRHDPCS
jgi:Pectate lyase superfamily protein